MAVLGRLLVSSAERLDLPDLLSLDSYAAGDWKYFLKGMVGDTKPFILKGFDVIDPGNAIGTQSCSIRVADSITFYPGSNSGSFFHGLQEGHPQAAPLVPELRKNAVNYVYLTFSTFNTSVDTRAFWDPDKDGGVGGEFTQDINTESVLKVDINVSTGSFPANTVPVAKITVGPVVITAIEDARDMMFRLGSGGINPNPFNTYGWRSLPSAGYERSEPPTQMLAGGINPFQGADKNILTLKEWMDAVMSKLRELGGTTYWYDDTSSFSIITNFYDAVATAFKSKGKWVHDTVTPGLLTWTEDIQIKMTSDPRTYIVRQGSKQLLDEQVMYMAMQRNLPFNATDESVSWTNGQLYVNTIGGAVGLFANLSKGDYVKKANDTIDKWVRVEEFYDAVNLGGSTTTAAGARSIRLGSVYLGSTGAEKGRYDKGAYLASEIVVSNRNQAAIANTGGNFHWLALRSDTIETVSNIVTTNLSVAIDDHDGSTARVTATAHGLVDGDRVTIAGTTNFDGTYQVEVETANIFYINISGGPFADESGTGHYATVTTAARSTPYGFQEESANHGFNSNDTIEIADTTNYDDSYQINVRSATTFTIAVDGPTATETSGTATLARVIVRTEGAVADLIQGQVIDIGGSIADNIRQYVGMESLSQTAPIYNIPPSYNTLDGMQNYNGVIGENLTDRLAKVTAMMADKAQDKTLQILASTGITSFTNTTNGLAQELRFVPDGASITIVTPGSDGQTFMALPDSTTPISLLEDQATYIIIDRNNPSTVTWTVADIVDVPVDENVLIVATRINTPEIYIWDATLVPSGSIPPPAFLPTIVQQNQALKLVRGGTWSWNNIPASTSYELEWSTDAFIQIPGITEGRNTIVADSVALPLDGDVAYVNVNRLAGANANLTVNVAQISALATGVDRFIIARRVGNDVIIGNHSMLLVDGESKKLYAGASDQTLAYIGSPNEADATPDYSSTTYVADGDNLTVAMGKVDQRLTDLTWKDPVADVASLPVSGNQDGDVRLILDTRLQYTWHQATTEWLPVNSTGGGIKILGGGILTWDGSSDDLSFDADMYLEIKGLDYTDNTIETATDSPINLPNDYDVAYVIPNLSPGGGSLSVNVDTLPNVPANAIVIARRENSEVIVGSSSTRLKAGQFTELYAQEAINTRDTVRSTDFLRSDNPVTWTGTQLQFTSDIVLESLNTRTGTTKLSSIQVADSPISIADGEVAWVLINRMSTSPSNVGVTVTSSVPTALEEFHEYVIIAKRVDALGAGYLHIPLHKQVIEPGQTVRLGANSSGSGSVGKNYLSSIVTSQSITPNVGNGNFELGTIAGWSLGTIGTLTNGLPTGTPTFGSGASGNLSITTVNSSQLAGSHSLSYASSAATTQGNMLSSDAFYIDSEDQAKVLSWKFYYKAQTNPTNANWSGTSANSFGVAVYDVTNSMWISNTGNFSMTQNSGIGLATGSFQTAINTTQIRFVVYNANATSGAATVYFDDFSVGPQTSPIGAVATDWMTFTPTGSWTTNTTYTGKYRRVGDSLEMEVALRFTAGPSAGNLSINIPNGWAIDTTKLADAGSRENLGNVNIFDLTGVGSGHIPGRVLYANSTSVIFLSTGDASSDSGFMETITPIAPITLVAGDVINASFKVPIVGWSSNVQMSNDTDTRVVMCKARGNPASASSGNVIIVPSTDFDTHGAYNTLTGRYTVPVSGFYKVYGSAASLNTNVTMYLYKNGVLDSILRGWVSAGDGAIAYGFATSIQCIAGDILDLRPNATLDVADITVTYERASGPSVIAASESVSVRYATTAGQAMNNTAPVMIYGTKSYDSHNAYNSSTGTFTAPISGKYRVVAAMATTAVVLSTTQAIQAQLHKNGGLVSLGSTLGNGGSNNYQSILSDSIDLVAGDTVQLKAFTSIATTAFTSASWNFMTIERTGN